MSKKNWKRETLKLDNLRVVWATLDRPDRTVNADGSYGIGVKLTDEAADTLTASVARVAASADFPAQEFQPGDVAKLNFRAAGVNRRTGQRWEDTPKVFDGNLVPLTPEQILKINRKTLVNVSVLVAPYNAIGENGKPGVSTKLAAVQIVTYDAGEEKGEDFGFAPIQAGNQSDAF